MGCSASVPGKNRRSSKITISTTGTEGGDIVPVKRRYGHPAYYKADGYEVGLRYKVKTHFISFYVGTARAGGQKVTVKEHHLPNCPNEEEIYNEVKLLAKLSHDNIPKLAEIFITNISVFMITDFMDGMRVRHYIDMKRKSTTLTVGAIKTIVKAITSATAYCHANGVIVRNLTADNVVVRKISEGVYETKIADFTLAVPDNSVKALCDHPLFEWESVPFMAPEALLGQVYSNKMDTWSIGVLLYLMLSAELPFDSTEDKELVDSIRNAKFDYKITNPVWCSQEFSKAKTLIDELLVVDQNERLTAKDIMKNEWLVVS